MVKIEIPEGGYSRMRTKGKKELSPAETAINMSYSAMLSAKKQHVYEWMKENFPELKDRKTVDLLRKQWTSANDLDTKLSIFEAIGVDHTSNEEINIAEKVLNHHFKAFDEIETALAATKRQDPDQLEEHDILELLSKYSNNPHKRLAFIFPESNSD